MLALANVIANFTKIMFIVYNVALLFMPSQQKVYYLCDCKLNVCTALRATTDEVLKK